METRPLSDVHQCHLKDQQWLHQESPQSLPSQLQISPLARIHPMEKYLLSWTAVLPSTSYNVALSSPMLKKLTSQSPASPETLLGPHTAETFYVQCALKTANSYRSPTHPVPWWFPMLNGLFGLSGTLSSRDTKLSWAPNQAFSYKATHAISSRSSTVLRPACGSFVFYLRLLSTTGSILSTWLRTVSLKASLKTHDFKITNVWVISPSSACVNSKSMALLRQRRNA